jgi:hypothetical protein
MRAIDVMVREVVTVHPDAGAGEARSGLICWLGCKNKRGPISGAGTSRSVAASYLSVARRL